MTDLRGFETTENESEGMPKIAGAVAVVALIGILGGVYVYETDNAQPKKIVTAMNIPSPTLPSVVTPPPPVVVPPTAPAQTVPAAPQMTAAPPPTSPVRTAQRHIVAPAAAPSSVVQPLDLPPTTGPMQPAPNTDAAPAATAPDVTPQTPPVEQPVEPSQAQPTPQ